MIDSNPPDIALDSRSSHPGVIDRIGMQGVELPVEYTSTDGKVFRSPGKVDISVNLLDPDAKGIHMSRLYLVVQQALESTTISFDVLQDAAKKCLESHDTTSSTAEIAVHFEYMKKVPALKTDNAGWRSYAVTMRSWFSKESHFSELSVEVVYSSTCPCSTALSKQLLQKDFHADFENEQTITKDQVLQWINKEATQVPIPHSQRSAATVTVLHEDSSAAVGIDQLITLVEQALQTPVQAAVKREDEQEFAKRNGENLMFAEDAARKIKSAIDTSLTTDDYTVHVQHFESLHPHDVVAICRKDS